MTDDLLQGFRLGDLLVEPLKGRVTGSDGVSHLPPLAVEVLLCLARRPGEIVDRETLLAEAWGEGRGSPEALSHAVGEIRLALGDQTGNPRFIQTLPRRGYRLLVPPRLEYAADADGAGDAAPVDEPGFFESLRRRGVIETAVAYLVTGWLIIQVADVVFDQLLLPQWVGTFVTLLVISGFPIAVLLAWFLEFRDGKAVLDTGDRSRSTARRISRAYAATVTAMAVAAVGVFVYDRTVGLPSAELPPPTDESTAPIEVAESSIAVLPFMNIDGSERTQVFALGFAEDVINRLATIPGLAVASRGDSWTMAPNSPSRDVRRRLRVAYYIEGSVRLDGDMLRVVVQLIDSATGFHIVSRDFEHRLDEFMEVQREITRLAVANLRVALPVREEQLVTSLYGDTDVDAYVLYRRGKQLLDQSMTAEALADAIDYYEQALAVDPEFAAAHAGKCIAYVSRFDLSSDAADIDLAEQSCGAAIAANPNLHMVYTALGDLYQFTGRAELAEQSYEEALAINPQSADAMRGLSRVYERQQKFQAAEDMLQRAIDVQPGNWNMLNALGGFLFAMGRYDEAADAYERALSINPQNFTALGNLGSALIMTGNFERGRKALEGSLDTRATPTVYSNLSAIYYYLGQYDAAADIAQQATQLSGGDPIKWVNLADALHFAGRSDRSQAAFRRAAELAEARLAVDPTDSDALCMLAWARMMTGSPDEARRLIDRGKTAAPNNPYVYYYDALIAMNDGNASAVIASLRQAVNLGFPTTMLAAEPYLEDLRSDSAFATLVADSE